MCLEQCMKCSKRTWMGSDLYQKLWRIVPVDMLPVAPQHGFRTSSLTCSLVPLPPSLCVGMSSYFPDLVPKSFERDNSSSYQWSEGVLKVARSSIWSGEIRSVLSEPACWAGQIEAMLRTQSLPSVVGPEALALRCPWELVCVVGLCQQGRRPGTAHFFPACPSNYR